jgi:hypothetical protein
LRSNVEGDDLVADEVVAGGNVVGQLDWGRGSVHEVLLEPFATVGFAANLVDLKPPSVPRVELAARCVAAVCKVGDHGTSVVRPVAAAITTFPVKGESVPGVGIEDTGSIAGLHTAVVGWVVDTIDRLEVGHLADGAGVAVTIPLTVRGRCPVHGLIANTNSNEITVRRDVGSEEDRDEGDG